jgi:hypothetical protein
MKTKIQLVYIAVFVMLLTNFNAKAQFMLINNHTNGCKVEISYEAWDSSCNVCFSGVIPIYVGMPVTIPVTCAVYDLCVTVLSIGGVSQAANHTSMNNCHTGQPITATGSNPSGCNNNSTTWSTLYGIVLGLFSNKKVIKTALNFW